MPSVRAGSVEAAIESVRRQRWEQWELIVVAQGSDRELRSTLDRLCAQDERVSQIWLTEKGVSRARNAGAGAARFDTITFVDDDCEAEPDWLETVNIALDDPAVGVVAGSLVAPARTGWRIAKCPNSVPRDFTLRPDRPERSLPESARFVSANLTLRRSVWDLVGPFDAELGAGSSFDGGEDLDYLMRIVDAEVPIRFCPQAIVRHTYGTRYGLRAVHGMSVAYAAGQGAVAGKLTLAGRDATPWRRQMRRECLTSPLRSLRLDRIPPRLSRLAAFERAYRRCVRQFRIDDRGLLVG
jgi:glycosyltransferase involved in cell wall biosynthesis